MGITREQAEEEFKRRGLSDEETPIKEKRKSTEDLSHISFGKKAIDTLLDATRIPVIKKAADKAVDIVSPIVRPTARLGRDAAIALTRSADVPAYLADLGRYGYEYGQHKLGDQREAPQVGKWQTQFGSRIENAIDTATHGYTKPRNKSERMSSAINQAAAELLITRGLGRAAKGASPALVRNIGKGLHAISEPSLSNIGATVGSTAAAHHYLENATDPNIAKVLLAGTLGGIAGGVSPSLARSIARPKDTAAAVAGKWSKFKPELYKKQKEMGLQPSLSMASESQTPIELELMMSKHPMSGDVLRKSLREREAKLAELLGVKGDLKEAVKIQEQFLAKEGAEQLRQGMSTRYEQGKKWFERILNKSKKEQDINVDDILHHIDKKYKVGREKTSDIARFEDSFPGYIEKELHKNIAESKANVASPMERIIENETNKITNLADRQKYGDQLRKALEKEHGPQLKVEPTEGASFNTLLDLKDKALTKMIETRADKQAHAQATEMHNLLRDKVYSYLKKNATPKEFNEYKKANAMWADYASSKQSNLKYYTYELLKKRTDQAALRSLKKEEGYIRAAAKELLPEERLELARTTLVDVGNDAGRFNIAKAHSSWERWSPQVQKDYLKLLPSQKARESFIDAMDFIGNNKEKIKAIANTSGSAYTMANINRYWEYAKMYATVVGVTTGIGGAAHHTIAGAVAGIIPTVLADVAARAGAKLWSNPEFLSRINKVVTAKNIKSQINHMNNLIEFGPVKQSLAAATKSAATQEKPKVED